MDCKTTKLIILFAIFSFIFSINTSMAQIQESEEIKNHWRSRFPGLWCEEGGDRATEWGDSSLCQEKYTQAFDQCWDLSLKTVEERNILEIEEKTRAFSHELLDCVDTEVQNQ